MTPAATPVHSAQSGGLDHTETARLAHYRRQLLQRGGEVGKSARFKHWITGGRYRSTYHKLLDSVVEAQHATMSTERSQALRQMHSHAARWQQKRSSRRGPSARGDAIRDQTSYDRERIQALQDSGELNTGGYHGTNSKMLDGLSKSGGRLLSHAQLLEEGGAPTTGEGEALTPVGGPKKDVFIGKGAAGLGTALGYADLAGKVPHYNPGLFRQSGLNQHVENLDAILETMNRTGEHSVGMQNPVTRDKVENERARMQQEVKRRQQPGAGHHAVSSAYPLMFDFHTDGLQMRNAEGRPERGPLAGEAMVGKQIDLTSRFRRVYAPRERMDSVHRHMSHIFGDEHKPEVLAMEGMDALGAGSRTGDSRAGTFEEMKYTAERAFQLQHWIKRHRQST